MRVEIKTIQGGLMGLIWLAQCLLLSDCSAPRPSSLTLASGQIINLQSLHGQWVFITYWADWCHACVAEIPAMNQLHALSQSQPIAVFGVHLTENNRKTLSSMAKQYQIEYPLITSLPEGAFDVGEVGSVPVTYIIDPKGRLKETLYGPQTFNDLLKPLPSVLQHLARK